MCLSFYWPLSNHPSEMRSCVGCGYWGTFQQRWVGYDFTISLMQLGGTVGTDFLVFQVPVVKSAILSINNILDDPSKSDATMNDIVAFQVQFMSVNLAPFFFLLCVSLIANICRNFWKIRKTNLIRQSGLFVSSKVTFFPGTVLIPLPTLSLGYFSAISYDLKELEKRVRTHANNSSKPLAYQQQKGKAVMKEWKRLYHRGKLLWSIIIQLNKPGRRQPMPTDSVTSTGLLNNEGIFRQNEITRQETLYG